jgi:hypothetical protein
VGAVWSVVLRRLAENIMAVLPLFIIFFIPVALGIYDLYHWSHSDAVIHDELLQKKAGYLNIPFFYLRTVVYFVIWFLLSRSLYRVSLTQDLQSEGGFVNKFRSISAPGMLLFAITATFASFDWLMSLDPHWYSTIFGVYFFAGSTLASITLITVIAARFRRQGILKDIITLEHYHDLGKLAFAFMILWAYMAFSQYFLIWYGNIPEETTWFHHRWDGGWKWITLLLVFGYFTIPFILLIGRGTKRNVVFLGVICFWLLFMHWVDLFWIVMPNYHHHLSVSWMDLTTMIGVGGLFLRLFWQKLLKHPVIPVKDPRLQESINLISH